MACADRWGPTSPMPFSRTDGEQRLVLGVADFAVHRPGVAEAPRPPTADFPPGSDGVLVLVVGGVRPPLLPRVLIGPFPVSPVTNALREFLQQLVRCWVLARDLGMQDARLGNVVSIPVDIGGLRRIVSSSPTLLESRQTRWAAGSPSSRSRGHHSTCRRSVSLRQARRPLPGDGPYRCNQSMAQTRVRASRSARPHHFETLPRTAACSLLRHVRDAARSLGLQPEAFDRGDQGANFRPTHTRSRQ